MEENDKLKKYEDYFGNSMGDLEKELEKSTKYLNIIDKEIEKFSNITISSKGGEHYLIEHIQNAIALQTQRQSIIKDIFSIKKIIMDYTIKDSSGESDGNKLWEQINKIIAESKEKDKKYEDLRRRYDIITNSGNISKNNDAEIDAEIDKVLEENKRKEN